MQDFHSLPEKNGKSGLMFVNRRTIESFIAYFFMLFCAGKNAGAILPKQQAVQ